MPSSTIISTRTRPTRRQRLWYQEQSTPPRQRKADTRWCPWLARVNTLSLPLPSMPTASRWASTISTSSARLHPDSHGGQSIRVTTPMLSSSVLPRRTRWTRTSRFTCRMKTRPSSRLLHGHIARTDSHSPWMPTAISSLTTSPPASTTLSMAWYM